MLEAWIGASGARGFQATDEVPGCRLSLPFKASLVRLAACSSQSCKLLASGTRSQTIQGSPCWPLKSKRLTKGEARALGVERLGLGCGPHLHARPCT